MKTPILLGMLAWAALAGEPNLPCDYFKSLLHFRLGALEAEQVSHYPFQTFDEKNGYCAEEMDHGGMGYMFAVWNMESGKIFGFSEPSGRDPNAYDTTFWAYRQGRWVELNDVAPPLSLQDFWDEHRPVPAELKPHAFFEMTLPRKGTTIKVWLKGICVKGDCENGYRIGREATYDHLELVWQAKRGRFVKGTRSRER